MERKAGRIAVISDTHGLLRPEVAEILKTCDAVIHGGDINSPEILEKIREINPSLYVVRGNNDKEWAENLPKELSFSLFGKEFYVVHNKKHIPKNLEKKDFEIYGHSHKYESYVQEGVQYLNPGSCGPRRFHQPVTMAVLTIEGEDFHIEKIDILPRVEQDKVPELSQKDMEKLIKGIMKELEKGTTIASMAKKLQVSKEFAEQVCRICVTHPGVSAHGIMNKIEVNKIVSKSSKNI